jgi:hypothetical protein
MRFTPGWYGVVRGPARTRGDGLLHEDPMARASWRGAPRSAGPQALALDPVASLGFTMTARRTLTVGP